MKPSTAFFWGLAFLAVILAIVTYCVITVGFDEPLPFLARVGLMSGIVGYLVCLGSLGK